MTGGGIVDRNDWTYALILSSSVSATSTSATDLYAQIHHAISLSLDKIGVDSRLALPRHCKDPQSPVRHPLAAIPPSQRQTRLMAKNRWATMKRSRQGLLIQGSLDRSSLP